MSSFFDQLGAGFTNAKRTVEQKVKNLNDTNKLTSQVKTEQNNIQQNLIAIGQKYYDLCRDNPDEDFRGMIEAIIKSEQAIAQLQREIEEVRSRNPELVPVPEQPAQTVGNAGTSDFRTCPNCGSRSQGDSAFCPNCGQKFVTTYDTIYQQNSVQNPVQDPVQDAPSVPEEQPADTIAQVFADELQADSDFSSDFHPNPAQDSDAVSVSSFCPYCGNKLSVPDARFCTECGRTL